MKHIIYTPTSKDGDPNMDQNQNCLLVTCQNDNHSPGPGRLIPSSHQRSELSNTILGTSAEEIRESGSAFQSLMVWEKKATHINISVSNGDLICHRMIIPAAPNQRDKVIC